MRVKELIAELQKYDPELDVMNFVCDKYSSPSLIEAVPVYHTGDCIPYNVQLYYDEKSDNDNIINRIKQYGFVDISI